MTEPTIAQVLGDITGNGRGDPATAKQIIGAQTWRSFEQTAGDDVPCIIKDLWPEGGLGFIGAAPKAGKTWLGLDTAIGVSTGTPVFGSFTVPNPLTVLYVALEGHRAAIRTRIGCITRGHNLDPDTTDLDNLHLAYKPKGINLADPSWAAALCDQASSINARFVIVDVLRRAARIKENDADSFGELVDLLNPITDQGISLGLLHHFNKTNEDTTKRTPGERMAGSGAMFGAFDVGLFITKSEGGARKLEIHTDIRDLAAPERFTITLHGDGTGPHGGFTYRDTLRLVREDAPEPQIKGNPLAIRSFIIESQGAATPKQIRDHFDISDGTLRERRHDLETIGVHYISAGAKSKYEVSYALTPQTPQYPATGSTTGSAEATPQPRTLEGQGAGTAGITAASEQTMPKRDYGVTTAGQEVSLTGEDDDAGYWAMLGAITHDPSEREDD